MVTEAVKPMAGDVAGNDNGAVTDSRSLVDSLVASGALDHLFELIDGVRIGLTGDGGLLGELTRVALERGLQGGMTSHLGYAPGDRESKAGGGHANPHNGSYPKTLSTPVGEAAVLVPRDRDGSFTPRLVPKHSRRLGGLDEMIISLYAGGMTVRGIQHHLEKTIGTDLGPGRYPTLPTRWATPCPNGGSGRWTSSIRSCAWTPSGSGCATTAGCRPRRRASPSASTWTGSGMCLSYGSRTTRAPPSGHMCASRWPTGAWATR